MRVGGGGLLEGAPQSPASAATSSVPQRRYSTVRPDSSVTSRTKSSYMSQRAEAELEQQPAIVSLDVRRENARRRLRRPGPDRPRLEHPHRRPAPRQLARHRTANDSSPDDDDVRCGHQKIIANP